MRVVAPLTPIVEKIHATAADTQAWLEGIRETTDSAFDGHLDVQAYLVQVAGDSVPLLAYALGPKLGATFLECMSLADAAAVTCYRAGPLMRASQNVPQDHPAHQAALRGGLGDVVSAVGFASANVACAVSFGLRSRREPLSRPARTALGRIAGHLGAASRMRFATGTDDAVLTVRGDVVHASGDAESRAARERLRDAAQHILKAKAESSRDPVGGLDFWTAMVDGRWTLVERTDTDGKRLLFARRNAPKTAEHRSLTERERTVLERAALGSPLSHVAYELGLANSTVSETLARALKKLGIQSRAELITLYASVVGAADA